MRGYLSVEIRQKTVIARLKNSAFNLRQKIKELGLMIKEKDKLIKELRARAHEVNSSVLTTLKNQNPDKNFLQALAELIKKRHPEL